MSNLVMILIGMMIGGGLGFLLASLCIASKCAGCMEEMERILQQRD